MGLQVSASSGGGNFEIAPEGTYVARCFKLIDLGTQKVEWQGAEKLQHKVLIIWELFGKDDAGKDIRMEDDRPFAITKKYTATLDERGRLRPDLEAWRGKKFTDQELENFDLKNVLGAYCMLQVVHSEDGKYANANALMSTKEKPEGVNPLVYFDIDDPDMDVFNSFSDRLKEQITAAAEWRGQDKPKPQEPVKTTPAADVVIEDLEGEPINLDDIPF